MSSEALSTVTTLADLVERLGNVPLDRIWCQPPPGTATVEDVIRIEAHENRLCELVEGVLVEKPLGFRESLLAMALGALLREFVLRGNLGIVAGSDGMLQLFDGLVRIPDVSFIAWSRVPGRKVPEHPVPLLAPDLAVEILSRTNTAAEMKRKREEYFSAGTKLIWQVDPAARTVEVYSSAAAPDEFSLLREPDLLGGGSVLPGLSVKLQDLFAELDRHG